jgi:acetolactate synthase-1/2/3 large subunit
MKITEYIVDILIKHGLNIFFAVTGGAIVPLIDAVSKRNDARLVFFQHEQSAAMACEGVYRETGKIAVALVTSGPGIQNTLNGICGCWYDSIPALFISGQVNISESLQTIKSQPRQRGFQEMPVIESMGHFTVFSKKIENSTIKHITDVFTDALHAIKSGRFGPSIIDLPVNIQMSNLYNIPNIVKTISESKKPLVVYGMGIRNSKSENLVKKLKLPFVTSWAAKDLFPHDDEFNIGCIGVYGSRAANFAIQTCDCLIILGSRLDTRQTGGCLQKFSKESKKIMVDIDEHEINKLNESGIKIDIPVICDLNTFLSLDLHISWSNSEWMNTLGNWKINYTHPLGGVYTFLDKITFPDNTTIIPDTGGNVVWTMQTLKLVKNQRLYTNLGNSSMGFSLPCSIGSALSDPTRTIVCIIGDGGLQMNIQELKTIVDYKLPIKILVINNSGYGIIKQFQDIYFNSNYVGTDFTPVDFCAIASAYGMKNIRINVEDNLPDIFLDSEPILVDIVIDQNQNIYPKLEFGNSLEHMYPFVELDFTSTNTRIERGWINK